MPKKILQKESPILRDIAKSVLMEEIVRPRIQRILKEMKVALEWQDDGVAIAAPQIGCSLRIFVISEKIFGMNGRSKQNKKNLEENNSKNLIFINPVIKKVSKEKNTVEEGCLSVRYLYGKVSRANKATIVAYDEHGKKFERGGTGLLAQIFQHEVDHLNGILFIDKAKYVEEILPEKLKSGKKIKNAKQ